MTPQATDTKEGGLTSYRSCSRKLQAITYVERARDREGGSETAWCAYAPSIGGGSARAGGSGGGSLGSRSPHAS